MYIEKKNEGWAMGNGHALLFKRTQHSAFFCVLLRKNVASLHSFMFFAKERCVLCILLRSLQNNIVFFVFFYVLCKTTLCSLQNNILFFAFFYVLKKRMQKNVSFFWVS